MTTKANATAAANPGGGRKAARELSKRIGHLDKLSVNLIEGCDMVSDFIVMLVSNAIDECLKAILLELAGTPGERRPEPASILGRALARFTTRPRKKTRRARSRRAK